ncbi:MAG: hypothetical protein WC471_00495 [Candidatus Woesearchaeota archaeon]
MLEFDRAIGLLKLEKDDFIDIKVNHITASDSNKKLCFIDGGNSEIISSAQLSLQMIKIVAVFMENNRLIKTLSEKKIIMIKPKEGAYEIEEIGKEKFTIKSNKDLKEIGNIVRNVYELRFCRKVQQDFEGLIIKDGAFEAFTELEKKELEKLTNICGLSKTSMDTFQDISLTGALNKIPGTWYLESEGYHIVKLNSLSRYSFRLDLKSLNIMDVIPALIFNSKDFVYPGYPYGLILVDRLARVSDQQTAYLKAYIEAKMGKDWKKISLLENSTNAHSVLDKLSF